MAFEIFAKLDSQGESLGEDHIFTGRKQDLSNVAKWLGDQYERNRRKKKVLQLSVAFEQGGALSVPFVRLNKNDSIELHRALCALMEVKKSTALKQVVATLNDSLWVY